MAAPKPLVPVIVGPTAAGKTAVALALSHHWPITVISADSRQIYRGLDIGTAKPTPEEQRTVPHLGLNLVDPGERFSAGQFAREAAEWLRGSEHARQPVVVGGSGFYVKAVADGLFREPPLDRARREVFKRWARGVDGIGRWAARLDPRYRGGGRQRAARAVEIALLTGRSLSWWQHRARAESIMHPWYVRLTLPRAVLRRRIEERVRTMLDAGLVQEVQAVLDGGVSPDAPGLDAVGYRQVVQHLVGGLPLRKLADAITTATRRYAKRQETWFGHQLLGHPVVTLDATDPPETSASRIAELWTRRHT